MDIIIFCTFLSLLSHSAIHTKLRVRVRTTGRSNKFYEFFAESYLILFLSIDEDFESVDFAENMEPNDFAPRDLAENIDLIDRPDSDLNEANEIVSAMLSRLRF